MESTDGVHKGAGCANVFCDGGDDSACYCMELSVTFISRLQIKNAISHEPAFCPTSTWPHSYPNIPLSYLDLAEPPPPSAFSYLILTWPQLSPNHLVPDIDQSITLIDQECAHQKHIGMNPTSSVLQTIEGRQDHSIMHLGMEPYEIFQMYATVLPAFVIILLHTHHHI